MYLRKTFNDFSIFLQSYSGSSNTVPNSAISTTVSASTTSNMSISSPSLSSTKVTNSSSKSSSNMSSTSSDQNTGNVGTGTNSATNGASSTSGRGGVVSNIPMVSQYIQTGMPFYQPPVYAYEDLQMMQQRMTQHVPGYYDLNYQTPTSIGAAGVRENVAYSTMSDGRFTRTDNNSSPVSNVCIYSFFLVLSQYLLINIYCFSGS